MALSDNAANPPVRKVTRKEAHKVYKSSHIYAGGMVGLTPSGYVKPFEPGDVWVGVAESEYYNSATTDGAASVRGNLSLAGATDLQCITGGEMLVTLSACTVADLGKAVYATADNTWALIGHPDAYVGKIIEIESGTTAFVRIREPGEKAPNGQGSYVQESRFAHDFLGNGATSATVYEGGFVCKTILGTGLNRVAAADGGITGTFDAVAEVALASIRQSVAMFEVDRGVTFECSFVVSDKADAAAVDIDWGLGTALTTNSEADIDHADMVNLACFHMDGNSDNILAQSDNNTTDVSATDTTIDNDSTTDVAKNFKIIVRVDGSVEFWINQARVLSTTTFAVASTASLAGFINMEKTSDDTTAAFICYYLRVAGARVAA